MLSTQLANHQLRRPALVERSTVDSSQYVYRPYTVPEISYRFKETFCNPKTFTVKHSAGAVTLKSEVRHPQKLRPVLTLSDTHKSYPHMSCADYIVVAAIPPWISMLDYLLSPTWRA